MKPFKTTKKGSVLVEALLSTVLFITAGSLSALMAYGLCLRIFLDAELFSLARAHLYKNNLGICKLSPLWNNLGLQGHVECSEESVRASLKWKTYKIHRSVTLAGHFL